MNNCCPARWLKIFKAISDKHRQKILFFINEHKQINATEIVNKIKLSQPTISHHLKILNDAGLIRVVKKGQNSAYSVNKQIIADCCLGFLKRI